MKAFTYYIYHIPTGSKYYGLRYKKGCHTSDLWNKYFTSSKEVKKLIKEYGILSFNVEIRKVFEDVEKAKEWEHKVLRRLKVLSKPEWLNKSTAKIASTKGFKYSEESKRKMSLKQSGPNNPMFGRAHTYETRQKISQAGKRPCSETTKTKISAKNLGHPKYFHKHSPEAIVKIREARAKQVFSEETKEKMRQTRLRYLEKKRSI